MSRISGQISVSDSFTVLLDNSLKENQSLTEQLRQRDEENAYEELSNKADSFCKLVAGNNSCSKETKSKESNSKVHVPQALRNQWDILYIYVKILIFMIIVFFSSFPCI